tara:strand:+ start:349 stop:627 length:279 start_codon:yes stop_codon:yes gene_type:complete
MTRPPIWLRITHFVLFFIAIYILFFWKEIGFPVRCEDGWVGWLFWAIFLFNGFYFVYFRFLGAMRIALIVALVLIYFNLLYHGFYAAECPMG